jgi:hypothetical protein
LHQCAKFLEIAFHYGKIGMEFFQRWVVGF